MPVPIKKIRQYIGHVEMRRDEVMANHTSLKIGGIVNTMLLPKNFDELLMTLETLKIIKAKRPIIIGRGTNLLFTDARVDRIVVKTSNVTGEPVLADNTRIRASCGVTLARLAQFAAENSLTGLEFAHGIPGTVGGGLYINAGAYGGELSGVTKSVTVLTDDGEIREMTRDECGFSYRHSAFMKDKSTVLFAEFELSYGDKNEIEETMREFARRRRESQPLDLPSAGSVFKRPVNGYAAALIEASGLKGYRIGGAAVSDKHAGFIVNLGGATFDEVMRLIDHIRNIVERDTGIRLEPELKIIAKKHL